MQPLRMYTGLSSPLVITGLDQVTSTGDDDYSVTRYTYDRFGNLTTLTDPLGQGEQYDYDLNGNMTSKVDRNNATTTYSYDNQGRQTHTQAGSDYLSQSYTLTGQVLSSGNGSKTTAYQYDSLGRLKSETTGTEVKTYNYNLADQRTGFTLTMGGVQQLNNIYGYDALGRMNSFNGGGVTANYDYDANGNRRYVSYGNGLREEYAYNKANLVTQVTNQRGSAVLSQYNYTYYLDGNQSGKSDHLGLVTSYQYNPQGALKSEREQRSGTLVQEYSYQYDDYNNRTRLTAAGAKSFTTDYTYDKNNRLRNESKTEGDTTYLVDYQYDPNGNMYSALQSLLTTATGSPSLKMTVGENLDGVTLYEYDGFNRQVGVKTAGTTASYSYLPNGLRESKTVNGTTTGFTWDGDQTVLTTTGSVNTKYLRGMNLIASQGSGTSYYLYNAHGDVVQLTNSSGTVTKEYDYDAFGNEQTPSANDQNPFRYCREYLDNETSTYYLRARYYNPVNGRFTQQDGWMYMNSNDPLSLNLYTYVNNNPLKHIDPSGHNPIILVEQFLYTPAGQQVMQQVQIWASEAGVSVQTFIANNMPVIQQLLNQVGQFGPEVYNYFSSGQAWNDIQSGVQWAGDKIKSGANSVRNWFNNTFGGGNSAPGDPNNWNHRDYFLKQVNNKALSNAISQLYRQGAKIGDGGTADMLRYEFNNGQALKHLQKANNMITNLNNILTNETLTQAERKLTYQLLNDLYDAVKYVSK